MTPLAQRKALGLEQTQMALRLEISYSHYQKIERGERKPSKYLQRLIDEIAAKVAKEDIK